MTRRVLVTGAAGLLGRHVVRHLAEQGWSVTGLFLAEADRADVEEWLDDAVIGNAADAEVARQAVSGSEAVVHLAAIPAPTLAAPEVVFGQNAVATFCVLDAASAAGIGRAVIASSIAATGLSFSPHQAKPPWLPLDELVPTQAADPYALSKLADEQTAAMMSRRSGMTTTALRMPFLATPFDRLGDYAAEVAANPRVGLPHVWSYLDSRDAATAIGLALQRTGGDSMVLGLAAPDNLTPYPTEQLLDAYLPGVPRRRQLPGRQSAVDTSLAETVLGFRPQHLWQVEPRDLPATIAEEPT